MNTLAKAIAACGLTVALVAPAFAQDDMDVSSITCSEFDGMDEAGQLAAATALVERLASNQSPSSARVRLSNICDNNDGATRLITAATSGMTMDN